MSKFQRLFVIASVVLHGTFGYVPSTIASSSSRPKAKSISTTQTTTTTQIISTRSRREHSHRQTIRRLSSPSSSSSSSSSSFWEFVWMAMQMPPRRSSNNVIANLQQNRQHERSGILHGGDRNTTKNNNNGDDDQDDDSCVLSNSTANTTETGTRLPDRNVTQSGSSSPYHHRNQTAAKTKTTMVSNQMMKLPEIPNFFPTMMTMTSSGSGTSSSKSGNRGSANNVVAKTAAAAAAAAASADATTWVELLQQRKPNETVTVADLEAILSQMAATNAAASIVAAAERERNYVLQPQYQDTLSQDASDYARGKITRGYRTSQQPIGSLSSSKSSSYQQQQQRQVAFPQPSRLSGRDIQRGTSVAASFFGLFLSVTILPNLWLIGLIMGTVYGVEITKDLVDHEDDDDENDEDDDEEEGDKALSMKGRIRRKSVLARLLIAAGSRLATWALQLYDYWKAMFFLYKTGQLSYEYWKTYSTLDRRFAIQDKIDAWNSRFAEGKRKFDAWEQENEVGRTILAGLRTVWLLDEQQRKRVSTRQISRYRLLQYVYDIKYWINRRLVKGRAWINKQFAPGGSLQDIAEGIRLDLMSQGSTKSRLGSVLTALILVNVCGSLFSLSPVFCSFMASVIAVIWPTWTSELFTRVGELGDEFQDRGRAKVSSMLPSGNAGAPGGGFSAPRLLGMYDKNRYHYYTRPDGRKKYYRTVQFNDNKNAPARRKKKKISKKKNENTAGIFDAFFWFNSDGKGMKRNDERRTWGVFRKIK